MDLSIQTLCLCLALSLTNAAPVHESSAADDGDAGMPDRCAGIEFDAIAPDETGTTLFFKGAYLWNGYHGPAQRSNQIFRELEAQNIGHVDAAFRMHNTENQDVHDRVFYFLNDKVFSFYNHALEDGYPKQIEQVFPGVPTHLDAAVECPSGECQTDSVLFFKGQEVHRYDIATKTVKTKTWAHLPVCTSALRWQEHYYCFHGNNFTRFHPLSGEVTGAYPKDARNYFMRCDNFGHGGASVAPKCSDIKLDAITTDDRGKTYMFTGTQYMRLDTVRDGLHPFPIARAWPEVSAGVDAVFSYTDKLYMIKDDQVYIYKQGAHYTLVEGYPKSLKEELGIEGHVDAAFVCPNEHLVHVIQGKQLRNIDLTATPRVMISDLPLSFTDLDAGLCGPEGIKIFKGSQYYRYDTLMLLFGSRMTPVAEDITPEMIGCKN